MVVEAVEFGKLGHDGTAVVEFKASLDTRANDIFAWDAVRFLSECAYEIDATARDDVGAKTMLAQILEQLDLRPIGAVLEQPSEFGVFGARQPAAGDRLKRFLRHAGVRGERQLEKRLFAESRKSLEILLEQSLIWLAILQRWIFGRKLFHPIDEEEHLRLQRLLAPKRAVVVEHGDALTRRYECRAALRSYRAYERDNRLLRRAISPRR